MTVHDNYNALKRVRLNVCTAPHDTAPGKIQYRTDEKSRMLPSNFVPEPSINSMWYFVFKMGMPIIKYVEISEKVA